MQAATATAQIPGVACQPGYIWTADNVGLFYRDWGGGKPLLFLAGWMLSSDMWAYQMEPLSRQGSDALPTTGAGMAGQAILGEATTSTPWLMISPSWRTRWTSRMRPQSPIPSRAARLSAT